MDEAKAREIIGRFIQPDDLLVGSHDGIDPRMAEFRSAGLALDGVFSPEELEAFAWWMRNKRWQGRT